MQNKLFLNIIFLAFLGCSSDNVTEIDNAINIFDNKNALLTTIKDKTQDAKLDIISDIKNISNAKSYNLTNSFIKLPLKKKWQVDTDQIIDDKNPYLPDLIYLAQNIFLLNNHGVLFKIETKNGKIVWKKSIFEKLEDTIIGTPALSGKLSNDGKVTIYAHNGSNEILALNGVNGKIIWKRNHRLPLRGGITSNKDTIFVGDFDGNFLSIDNNNGQINWNAFIGSDYNSVYTTARPIVAKDKIIVPGTGGAFFILSSDTGEFLWSENISSNKQLPKIFHSGDIVANPIFHKGIIYIVSQSGFTAAFDINTSEELWKIPVGGIETPTLSGKTIFVNGHMGLLTAIDIVSGKLRWKKKYPSYINENSLLSDKEIAIYKGPTLAGSKILLSDLDGIINIIDANNGNEISTLKIDKLALPPIPANKNIFFLTANGKLLAYK
tara:strand:+ start:1097 stop:2407 length:1311 start_codon:yes stop_codon:yes gene_type:complete